MLNMKNKIIGSILVIILVMQILMPLVLGAQSEQVVNDEDIDVTEDTVEDKNEIQFEDSNLKDYMIKNYDADADGEITEYDMNQITEINIDESLTSIKGLEYLKNVETIRLYNCCRDISPLTNLENLKTLYLGGTDINVEQLGDFPNLENLSISMYYIDSTDNYDYSKIAEYTNLKELTISNSKGFDCSILENLKNLETLYLQGGIIKNYEQIGNVPTLKTLYMTNMKGIVTNIEFISNLTKLTTLDLRDNNITNIEPLENLMELTNVNLTQNSINPEEEGNKRTIEALKQRDVNLVIDEYDKTINITFVHEEMKKQLIQQGYDINKDNELSTYEMQQIYSFTSYTAGIKSIEDLKYATNLNYLSLLALEENKIDITPLSNLTNLQTIEMTGSNIEWGDFSALKNLTNLKNLKISIYSSAGQTTQTTMDFEGLKANTNLDTFSIAGDYLNISDALTLNNLRELSITQQLRYVQDDIIDLTPIKDFERLEKLYVYGNVSNVNSIYENNNIIDLTINDADTNDKKALDVTGIENMTNLKNLSISGYLEDVTSLKQLNNLDRFSLTSGTCYGESGEVYCLEDEKLVDLVQSIVAKEIRLSGAYKAQIGRFEKGREQTLDLKNAGKLLNAISTEGNKLYDSNYSANVVNSYLGNATISTDKKIVLKCDEVGTQSNQLYINSNIFSGNLYIDWQVYENGDTTTEIEIKDNNLKKYLLDNFDIDNDDRFTENDAINIDTININNMQISNLEGLESCINLKNIFAENNNITSLEPLRNLENLKQFNFNNNQIKDISPLANKDKITEICSIANNLIEDITPLKSAKNNLYNLFNFAGNYVDISDGTENRKAIEGKAENDFELKYTVTLFEMTQKYGSIDERDDVLDIKDTLKQKFIEYGIDKNSDGQITKGELNDFNSEEVYGEGGTYNNYKMDLSNMELEDKDIECLSYLSCISELDLSNNNLRDVSPITYIKNVRKLNLSNNNVDINTLTNKGYLIEINLSNNNITDISALDKLGYDSGFYGWGAGGDSELRTLKIDLSYNDITNINVIKNIRRIAKLDLSHNKIIDISPLKDYDFYCYEYDGQVNEMLEYFEGIDVSYNNIDINKEGNKQAIKVFEDKGVKLIYDNQTVTNPDEYIGDINSELVQFNVGQAGGATYVSGEIIYVEWVNGQSTVPKVAPKMRFKSTDGTVDMEAFVTSTGTNTYYFDRYIEGIDTSKKYYFEIESGDPNNISTSNKMNVYFSGTKFEDTVVGRYKSKRIRLKGQEITFEDDTYVGNINSELVQFNVGQSGGATYVSGELIYVEWVDGKSTVPEVAPKMRFKSTDGTIDMEAFVTSTGTNTYYFDRYIEGIDTSKKYYFEIESGDPRNVSTSNKMNVYFSGTKFEDTVPGKYKDKRIRLKGQEITFEDDTYVGNINSELVQFNVGQSGGATYVSGEIIYVEWVDGKSTVPEVAPKMRFKSTDGTIDMEAFVTSTGTNTYYFDRYIEGIDTSKKYYFEIESGDPRNVSTSNKMNVYFSGTKFENTVAGKYKDKRIRLKGQEITFEDDTYVGNINSQLVQLNVGEANGATYLSGEIIYVEWVDGKSTVPEVAPKMRFKSTDGTVDMEVFVTSTGTNTYYFDRYIEGISLDKQYYFEIESGDSRNISENKKMTVLFLGEFENKIIGAYGIEKMVVLENNTIVFKPLDKSFPVIMNANEQETFDLVNQQRIANGVAPLQIDSRLQLLARKKAEDMVANGYFDHQSPTYGSPFDMMNTAGIYYYTASENIAGGYSNSLVVTLWMNSTEGHRENILNSSFNYTGVGVVEGGPYGRMYVQIFIGV